MVMRVPSAILAVLCSITLLSGGAAANSSVTRAHLAQEKAAANADTVGWLTVPGTAIDEPVVQSLESNDYYQRRNSVGRMSWEGSYFADFRCDFGSGKRADLPANTVIYGHSVDEDPNGGRFSQLKKYTDPDFARAHPYICFSTQQTNAVYEVFAVFVTTVELPYNVPTLDAAQRAAIVDVAQFYSIYDYGVTITDADKLLTLSSESYAYDSSYPNNYRFVVMARLVEQNTP